MSFWPNLARICACALALALAGCNETLGPLDASTPVVSMGNPRNVPVAFTSLEGPPASVSTRFIEKLASEARNRDIRPVEAEGARYFVLGYLDAAAGEANTTRFTYVWDVFDANQTRIQRVEDQISVRGTARDPWSLADDLILSSLASKSAEDLAGLIASLPEAQAEARTPKLTQTAALSE
jgi:hypothetical protein